MGTRRSDSPLFPLWGHGSAQYLQGFGGCGLGLVVRLSWALGQRGLDTGLPQEVGELCDLQRLQYGQLLDIEVAGYLGQLRKKRRALDPLCVNLRNVEAKQPSSAPNLLLIGTSATQEKACAGNSHQRVRSCTSLNIREIT